MMIKKIFSNLKLFYAVLIIFLFVIFLLSRGWIYGKDELSYGVTYSSKQAESLGLDPQKTYLEILDDLKVKKIRLSAYWDEVETENGIFAWNNLDWQIKEAQKRNVEIILAVGSRLPRWPECHTPEWAKSLSEMNREEKVLKYISTTIKRYKDYTAIKNWQVENEPFLPNFGECPKLDEGFLDKEIALVKSIDNRPIVLTDSGELSLWVPAAKRADIFGTTMYRDTYSNTLKSYIHYPIEPGFFRFKKNISSLFANPKKWIVIELQAEPWGPKPFQELSQEDRDKTMNFQKFKEILEFSRQAGFNEFYLWGVEWWYWEKTVKNNDIYWEEAKKLFK
jgi:hypothetical protein